MNRLSLAQKLITECGISGAMTTTISQTGEFARVVGWIDQAWQEVQTEHDDWKWMRSSNLLNPGTTGAQFITTAARAIYPLGNVVGTNCGVLAANFGKWAKGSFRNYVTTVGVNSEMHMDDISYDEWRDCYMFGAMRSVQTRPIVIAAAPDESLCVGPPSNGLYTITGDYYVAPTVMALDADTPTGLPVAYHLIIVYQAMIYYAYYEGASEVLQRGREGYGMLLAQLEALKLPELVLGPPLA